MSPPQSETGVVATNWGRTGPAFEGLSKVFGGTAWVPPIGAIGLIIAPFALAYDAAQCEPKLDAAYPGIFQRFSEIVQREFSPADVQDQFVAVLQEGTSVPIAREEIVFGKDQAEGEQQLLAAAAQHSRAHLFLIEISSVSVQPSGNECEHWQVWAKMRIQVWKVADRKLVLSFSPGVTAFVAGQLSDIRSVFDEPGALRSRLKPTYEDAARMFFYRAMFQLPP